MSMNTPEKYSDILKIFHEMLLEKEVDINSIPIDQVNEELAGEGIFVSSIITEVKSMIAKKQVQRKLDVARAKRSALQQVATLRGEKNLSNVREKIIEIFNELGVVQPTLASAFFRKLEDVNDDDLMSILEDLELLERPDNGFE